MKNPKTKSARRKARSAPPHGSAYSLAILKSIREQAMKIKGATSVSHIYPRAYCIAKPAPMCAVFVTPWMDAEPQVRQSDCSSSHTVVHGVEKVRVGDWCSIAYVTTAGMGTQYVVGMPNDDYQTPVR